MQTSTLRQLLALGKAIVGATSYAQTSEVLTEHAAHLVGARNVTIAVVDPVGEVAHVYRGPNAVGRAIPIRVVSLSENSPVTEPLRTGKPTVISSSEEFAERYPQLAGLLREGEVSRLRAYPLIHNGVVVGSMFFRFDDAAHMDDAADEILTEIVDIVVQQVGRIKTSESLTTHVERLEQSNADLENYAAVVAHDFRGPVRRIGSFTQLLVKEVGPHMSSKASEYAGVITRQVDFLSNLLSDVLEYASALNQTAPDESVDLDQLARDVVAEIASDIATAKAKISWENLPVVTGDPILLKQVFLNMIQNSIQYSKKDCPPAIVVSSTSQPEMENTPWWRISICDEGVGMETDAKDGAFKMFSRLDPEDGLSGTGIGLAFCRRVIEHHGGEIGVESALGEGSEFWFTLPGPPSAHQFPAPT